MRPFAALRTLCACASLAVLTFVSACGGSGSRPAPTPTQPAPPAPAPPAPGPSGGLMSGLVVDFATGSPVPGATITIDTGTNRTTVTTSSSGAWEYAQAVGTPLAVPMEITAPGYVTRKAYVRWQLGTRTDIRIDLIREAAPFSMLFYRQFVRNLFDSPDDPPEPLRRWTTNPNFYINIENPRRPGEIPQNERDRLAVLIRDAVPALSGGRLQAGTIEFAAGSRPATIGTIAVTFFYDAAADRCGSASVAANPGRIQINYGATEICGSRCGNFASRTIVHEIGHAMGFWHVEDGWVMNTDWFDRDCDKVAFSSAELFHANLAYSRPRGNLDPDVDPSTATFLQADAPTVTLHCR